MTAGEEGAAAQEAPAEKTGAGAALSGVGQMHAALRQGRVDSVSLVRRALVAAQESQRDLNAFTRIDAHGALEAAEESDRRYAAGAWRGPLDGIPFAVKDNLAVAGLPATWGSELWHDHVPERDDIAVERLRRAGAIVIGKTNTPELAMSGVTDNLLFGPTLNPAAPGCTPGGSSGGSAAAIAAGIVPFSLVTDAGGSARNPAAYCGLYGLRPTTGRIPRLEEFPPLALDFQVIGLLAARLDDLRTVLDVVAGPDARDIASFALPCPASGGDDGGVTGLRVDWFDAVGGAPVDPVVAARVSETAARLTQRGAHVKAGVAPYDLGQVRRVWATLTAAGAAHVVVARDPDGSRPLSIPVAALVSRGVRVGVGEYHSALDELRALRALIGRQWGDAEVLLMPTTAAPAWPVGEPHPAEIGGAPADARSQSVFTTWVNAAGLPALSVPAEPHPDGRPIGVQLVARPGREDLLFALAAAIAAP